MTAQQSSQGFHGYDYIKCQFALRQRQGDLHCATFHIMKLTMKRYTFFLCLFFALLALSGCGKKASPCPSITGTPVNLSVPPDAFPTSTSGPTPTQVVMEIGGKSIRVDKVIKGPLCNDTWSGTVYVGCDVQVYPWVESPDFLRNCKLTIEPGTVVYVAHHNDSAYYNGCSCHTGETSEP